MKTPLFALLLLVPALLSAQSPAPERPDVPRLTAKTARWSWTENVFTDEKGAEVKETVRIQGVEVEVYFTSRPRRAYEVQAFFLARTEDRGAPYIYDAKIVRSQDQVHQFVLKAEPLLGTVKRSERLSLVGFLDDGRSFVGEARKDHTESGSKVYGWIVRVISAGKVVRLESNQTSLKKLAETQPELFDQALIELETAAASEN